MVASLPKGATGPPTTACSQRLTQQLEPSCQKVRTVLLGVCQARPSRRCPAVLLGNGMFLQDRGFQTVL